MNDDDRHALRDALYVLFKRRVRITLFTLAGLALGLGCGAVFGPTYTASARILVTPTPGAANQQAVAQGTSPALVLQANGQTARNQAELFSDPRRGPPAGADAGKPAAAPSAWLRGTRRRLAARQGRCQ